jgi:Domain of unknown function (DUF1929)
VAVSIACQDSVRPEPVDGHLARISATYLCGTDFSLHNGSTQEQTVQYRVLGTDEAGELSLPAAAESASTTLLTTLEQGSLQLSARGKVGEAIANQSVPCLPAATAEPQASVGEWSQPFPWPVVAVHLHLLPDGRVLSWGKLGGPQLYDPTNGSFTELPSSTMLFCSGHTFLADGSLLVSGGHLDDRRGLPDANILDPAARMWRSLPRMSYPRWYPTTTTLTNGEVLSLAGTDEAALNVETPELWDGTSWRPLTGARRELPYYPRTFVAPNGLVFYAGELSQSAYLDPAGSGRWIPVAASRYGRRDYGSAVMYAPGKVMIVGGSDPPDGAPTNTAELIDLSAVAPAWRYTGSMAYARRHLNATLLPDGNVVVTGGTSVAGFTELSGAVHEAEVWSPGSEQWKTLAANQVSRVYHSSTILLPDGRLLHAGSGDGPGLPRELNAELFSPPYLFRGDRPVLHSAPERIAYGQPIFLATSDAGKVVRITLVRLPSVTHAFDQSQRFVELEFRRTAGGLTAEAPASGRLAPPGPYLLFLLNRNGVPSIARTILVY